MLSLGNKLTLPTQPIYKFVNKYSIDFDGVDDCIITDGADTVAQPTTYSFWCKSSETGNNYGVFGHGSFKEGAFHFNQNLNRPLLWLGSSYYVYWNDTSAQDDGEWHHWVVYLDTSSATNCKLYVDGVLQTVSYVSNTPSSIIPYTESLTIGGDKAVGGNYFLGKIDEFAVYDRELTQAEITRMYNTYYSPNRVANGNFSQIGNEEVTNGDFSQIGSEQANYSDNNIEFYNQSDSTTISLGSNSYRSEAFGNSGDSRPRVQINGSGIVTGKTYKVVYTPTSFTGNTVFDFRVNGARIINNHDASLPKTFYFVATDSVDAFDFDGSQTFRSDYTLSVKEVGQDWSLGVTWSMGDGVANFEGSGSTTSALIQTQNINLSSGKSYNIKFDISNATGNASIWIGNGVGSVNYFGTSYVNRPNGSYDLYFTMPSTQTSLSFYANQSGSNFTIDNISVKEVGKHWTVPTGWSIENEKAVSSSDNNTFQTDSAILTENATFKVTFNITDYTSGTLNVDLGSGSSTTSFDSEGFKTATLIASGFNRPRFYGGNFVGSIDNIVVQELKHDATNLMLNAGAYQSANPLITSTKSMEFDGTDDFLNISHSSVLDFTNNKFSFSAWVYAENSTYGTIIGKTGRYTYYAGTSSIKQRLFVNGSSGNLSADSNTFLEQNKWSFISVTWSGSVVRFYINGVYDGGGALVNTLTGQTTPITVGKSVTEFFDGKITELGMYDRVLTDLEVASLYNQGMPTNLLVNRNNYQSGNPTVFNTKQVDFDGTDDYLDLGSQSANSSLTYSAWVKLTDNSAGLILQYGKSMIRFGNATTLNWWSDISSAQLNTTISSIEDQWSHIVVTQTGQNAVVYLNGVQVNSSTSQAVVNTASNDSAIGKYVNSNTWHFTGEISQVGIWNEVLTANEVSSLYNHGLPIDLTTDQAAYESSSNLVGYWRMGSGTLDSYPLIADQINPTLSAEYVVNGNFSNGTTGWTAPTQDGAYQQLTADGLKMYAGTALGASNLLSTTTTFNLSGTEGKVYKADIVSSDFVVGTTMSFRLNGVYNASNIISFETGTQTVYFIAYQDFTFIKFFAGSFGQGFTLKSISIKEVGGNPAIMTNQTSSDIENGSPYANIVQNSDFSDTSFWTVETPEAEISNGKVNFNTTLQNYGIYKTSLLTSSVEYKVVFTIDSYTSGAVHLNIGGSVVNSYNAKDTYTAYVTGGGTNVFGIQSDSGGAVLSINNVTVTEVNTGLQGYWKMGDGTNDKYPYIYDQVDPTLNSEEVVNGSFTGVANGTDVTTLTNWNAYGSPTSRNVVDNKLVIVATGGNQGAYYDLGTLTGTYKLSVDITGDVGLGGLYIAATANHNLTTSVGTLEYAFVASGSAIIFFRAAANSTGTTSYTNISVKKVNGNLATMTNMVEGNITNQYPLTKIRNYYRMGDGILDGYPIIQDQTSPNLAHIPTTNILTYSEDFSNADWVKSLITFTPNYAVSPSGEENAYRLVSSGGAYPQFYKNISGLTIGQDYTVSFYVKSDGTTQVEQSAHMTGISPTITFTPTNDWVRIEYTRTATANSNLFVIFTNSGSAAACSYLIWGYQIEQQSQATAYIKSDGIAAVRKSSTTNLETKSNGFSTWTSSSGATATANYIVSPDGTQNAARIQFTSNGFLYNTAQGVSSTLFTISCYAKRNDSGTQSVGFFTNGSGTVDSAWSLTSDWKRFTYTYTSTNTSNIGIAGVGGADVSVFGFQIEHQTQAETYVPTYGLPVTIDLFTENNYGTMTNMSASDIIEDTPNN